MSEFGEIIEFIGKIVKWVIERTIDLLCLCVLLVSSAPPWRLIENFNLQISDFRELACVSLLLTICDCLVIPLGCISMVSPLQWYGLYCACRQYRVSDAW